MSPSLVSGGSIFDGGEVEEDKMEPFFDYSK
jgi:hypothetical protein